MRLRSVLAFIPLCLGLVACESHDKAVRGQATLSLELQKTLQPGATLYVIARKPGQLAGPPLAVKRIGPPLPGRFRAFGQRSHDAGWRVRR
jgi:hypothetical protein